MNLTRSMPVSENFIRVLNGDWPELSVEEAQQLTVEAFRHNLAPYLWWLIRHNQQESKFPSQILDKLKNTYQIVMADNLIKSVVQKKALAALSSAHIPVIVLKGAALLSEVYPSPGLRSMVDIDILVRMEDADPALAVLKMSGFEEVSTPDLRKNFNREFRVEAELIYKGAINTNFEVHWQLTGPLFACRFLDREKLWQRARRRTGPDQNVFVLSPEDWILHTVIHMIYKHRHIPLRDLLDLDRLIRRYADGLDWELLLQIGAENHWLIALKRALEALLSIFHTPVPGWVLERCKANRLDLFEEWLVETWLDGKAPERHHVLIDWLLMPSWSARLRFLAGYLFPSREYFAAVETDFKPERIFKHYLKYYRDQFRA